MCNLCETLIKTESAWSSHLHSTQHTLRLSRAQDAAAARTAKGNSKKRKASTIDSPSPEERKKAKPTNFAPGVDIDEEGEPRSEPPPAQTESVFTNNKDTDEVNVAELEALDKELAELEASMPLSNAGYAQPTISAPAMTAEDIAVQAREKQSAQRGKRDAELEAEKEDAARLVEDEFEEMEGLEERAKKLRERREALRKLSTLESKDNPSAENAKVDGEAVHEAVPEDAQEDEDEDDDDDEDLDDWNFGTG